MNRLHAHQVLDVAPGASRAQIQAAYRRAVTRCHPDRGGTDEAMAEVNAARQLLLKSPISGTTSQAAADLDDFNALARSVVAWLQKVMQQAPSAPPAKTRGRRRAPL